MNITAQVLGLIALFLSVCSYVSKGKTAFLLFQITANIFYASSFFVLNALVGGLNTIISVFRCIYLIFYNKYDFKYKNLYLYFFVLMYVLIGIIFWKYWFDIIPIATSTLYTFAYPMKNMQHMRLILIIPSFLLIFYCILVGAYTSALLDVFEIIVLMVIFFSYKRKTK